MSKSKNLARNLPVNTSELGKEVRQHPPESRAEVWNLVNVLGARITGDNLSESEHQQHLHSSRGWDQLKKVTLENRHVQVPHSCLPASETALYEFCLLLLSRDGDDDMRCNFLRVVAGDQTPNNFLQKFCKELWKTNSLDPDFYRYVVSGDHKGAARFLKVNRRSNTLPHADGTRLLTVMALIWAAHDVQTSTALAMKASTRPLGWLLMGAGKRITAGTIFSIFRPIFHLTRRMFGDYRTVEESRNGKAEGKLSRKDIVQNVRQRIFPWLNRSQLRKHKRLSRDKLVVDLRDDIANKSDDFWDEIRLPKDSGKYTHKRMTQIWYADLTPVEVVALAVLRFMQAEQVLARQIQSLLHHPSLPRAYVLPVFDPTKLRWGWKTRARLLIADQRRVILKDGDKDSVQIARGESVDDAAAGQPSKNDTVIDNVIDFLQRAGHRKLHGSNPWYPEVRTLTKLDVGVNRRFGFK